MADDKLNILRNTGLNIDDPNFLSEYSGKNLSYGDNIFQVNQEGVQFLGNAGDKTGDFRFTSDIANNTIGFDQAGLQPAGKSSFQQEEGFRYFTKTSDAYQKAAAGGFGHGIQPTQEEYSAGGETSTLGNAKVYLLKTGEWTSKQPPTATSGPAVDPTFQVGVGNNKNMTQLEQEAMAANSGQQSGVQAAGLVAPPDTGTDKLETGDGITDAVVAGDIPFKDGLSPEQQQSITNLLNKDTTAWTATDVGNWNYATNNAPLPGGTAQTFDALSPQQVSELDAASQRIGTESEGDKDQENIDYAQENFGYEPTLPEERDEQQVQVDKLMEDNNITVDPEQEPKTQFMDVYEQSLIEQGATTAKTQAEGYAKELREMNDKMDEEIRDINDNPWLTEGIRKRRIASIEGKYESKLGNLTGQFNLAQNLYETAVSQAQFVASQSLTQNRWQQEMDQNMQFKLMDMAQKNLDSLGGADLSGLSPEQISAGNFLAKQLYGSSTIKTKDGYNNFVKPILARMANGEGLDDISDDLRFQGQSSDFTGTIREAAQQITASMSTKQTEAVFDKLDDALASGDSKQVQDFLRKIARDEAGVDEQRQVSGSERTIEFLDEVRDDLQKLEDAGINTNIFTGTEEEIAKKVGTVKSAEMRQVATKIAIGIQKYRRSMSGVAFSEPESKEYKDIFPNINKTAEFNTATLNALDEVLNGDVDFFYGNSMGTDAYEEIFKNDSLSGSNLFINQSYRTLDDLITAQPEFRDVIAEIDNLNPNLTDAEIIQEITKIYSGFNQDLSKSKNYLGNFGQITGLGSSLWKHGLDVDLAIGDNVPSPVSGKVVFVGENGGFGNQVQIKDAHGNTYWLSHLDSTSVKVGDTVNKGAEIGTGGNTGQTIPGEGGDGSHLDITVKLANGSYATPQAIKNSLA